jgi:hypothetical protein
LSSDAPVLIAAKHGGANPDARIRKILASSSLSNRERLILRRILQLAEQPPKRDDSTLNQYHGHGVMAGLVPAIHAFESASLSKNVDARHKAGHDGADQFMSSGLLRRLRSSQ